MWDLVGSVIITFFPVDYAFSYSCWLSSYSTINFYFIDLYTCLFYFYRKCETMYFIPWLAHASFLIDGSTCVFMHHFFEVLRLKRKAVKFFPLKSQVSSVQSLSRVRLFAIPESTQTHVHWVGDAIQPSHPLSSPSPPALNFSQHQGLFKSIGVSASKSVLPMNTQDWSPLGWTQSQSGDLKN